LTPDDTVLDVGARRCELLIRLVERYRCRAVGVDIVAGFAMSTAQRADGRIPPDRLAAHQMTAAEFFARHPANDYASAICVGSSSAFGGYVDMLRGLLGRTRAGAVLFVGYPFRNPAPGSARSAGHEAHIALARQLDLEVVLDWVATAEDWQGFHRRMLGGYQAYAAEHPHDPDSQLFLNAGIRRQYVEFLESIRRATGFGYGLFRVPARSACWA